MSYVYADEIKLGNHIINNIEQLDELPEDDDWAVLKKMGLKPEYHVDEPDYEKLPEQEFQITFVRGFDPPYFHWNSIEREWKLDFPKIKTE